MVGAEEASCLLLCCVFEPVGWGNYVHVIFVWGAALSPGHLGLDSALLGDEIIV